MRILLIVAFVAGCSKPEPEPVRPDPSTRPGESAVAPVAPTPKLSERIRCAADSDCTVSCALGAVNAAWWTAWDKDGECKDGCAEGSRAVCRDGRCVALNNITGAVDPGCTKSP